MKNLLLILILVASLGNLNAQDFCQFGRFEPCVCWYDVPKTVSYRPSERLCKGRAAVIMRSKYFSVVLRDKENNDRIPKELSFCSDNSCSVFKTQKVITRVRNGIKEKVNCLGAPGNSKIMSTAVRITVKVSDIPNKKTGLKPIDRFCLRSPKVKLN